MHEIKHSKVPMKVQIELFQALLLSIKIRISKTCTEGPRLTRFLGLGKNRVT